MAQRGTLFDSGAAACPFVALELDRDRRSDRPDYRHRCYAEPTPSPRTIAHQERYCLSPNFPGCPIFQDWAVRAAARPVPLPAGQDGGRRGPDPRAPDAAGLTASGMAAAGAAADTAGAATDTAGAAASAGAAEIASVESRDSSLDPSEFEGLLPPAAEAWPDSMSAAAPSTPAPGAGGDDRFFDRDVAQLAAFDPPSQPENDPLDTLQAGEGVPSFDRNAPPDDFDDPEPAAPVPAFLVGRSSRPPQPAPSADERVGREDVVPSWEIDGRYGAQAADNPDRKGMLNRLLTIIAVIVILGLGVAAVILVPGLLNGPAPGSTARPSSAVPSAAGSASPGSSPQASAVPSSTGPTPTPSATAGQVTPGPTAAGSPIAYRIKPGDTLAKVARKHDITIEELLAANPQITNPDHIEVGQVIFIPLPATTPAP